VNNCVGFVHVVNSSLRIRKVKDYLKYLNKEIDLLFNYLNANNIKLNVGTVFFGGGS
jgi:coproporphyrinogen III oxidase-like Fe-S oxidoreductase